MRRTKVLIGVGVISVWCLVFVCVHVLWQGSHPPIIVNDTGHDVTYRLLNVRSSRPNVVVGYSQVLPAGSEADVRGNDCAFVEDGKGNVQSSILLTDVPAKLKFVFSSRFLLSENHVSCDFAKSDAVCERSWKEGSTPAESCP